MTMSEIVLLYSSYSKFNKLWTDVHKAKIQSVVSPHCSHKCNLKLALVTTALLSISLEFPLHRIGVRSLLEHLSRKTTTQCMKICKKCICLLFMETVLRSYKKRVIFIQENQLNLLKQSENL
jgi:hypothetical protein